MTSKVVNLDSFKPKIKKGHKMTLKEIIAFAEKHSK
jgi:hypothetical protein